MSTCYHLSTYADSTRFCRLILVRPWQRCMRELNIDMLQSFFEWHVWQERRKDGRKKRATRVTRPLQTFWNSFSSLYRREMLTDPYKRVDNQAVRNVSHPSDARYFQILPQASQSYPRKIFYAPQFNVTHQLMWRSARTSSS